MVELRESYCFFDYWKGEFPKIDCEKKIYVFFSHSHYDHFSMRIFLELEKQNVKKEQITVIISEDISKDIFSSEYQIFSMAPHTICKIDQEMKVETLRSNDLGVAFIVTTNEGVIYHAGDLNEWYWEGEPKEDNDRLVAEFIQEMECIKGRTFDVAFMLLDPRQEADYARGMLRFLETVCVKKVYPIHYENHPEVIQKFYEEYPQYKTVIRKGSKEEKEYEI